MNKVKLIQKLGQKEGLTKQQARKIIDLFFDAMAKGMANCGRVEIRGLCTFKVRQYESYTSRNPKTGEPVVVRAKKLPYFKPGTDLKRRVNRSSDPEK